MGKQKSSDKLAGLNANQKKIVMQALTSALITRSRMAYALGISYAGKRDLYEDLGYSRDLTFNNYMSCYQREDIAAAIINAPVDDSWGMPPTITESKEKETKFEKDWEQLVGERKIFHYLARVDRLARIGTWAVLFLGFDGKEPLDQEVKSATKLFYLMPYSQENASIDSYVKDPKNSRFGLPEIYNISMNGAISTGSGITQKVHWSRVIHVAEDCLENDVEGTPALRCVFNRLQDLEKIVGGSAEGYWRGAFPGFNFSKESGTEWTQDIDTLIDQLEDYVHGFKRYLRTTGINVQALTQQLADPTAHVAVQIDLIASAVRIPKRILLGSERGELASSQDEKAWLTRIDRRRKLHCEPVILRPFIDRLIDVGVLAKPTQPYSADWPDLMAPGEKEIAEIGEIRSRSLAAYVNALGADAIIPPEIFENKFLGLSPEKISEIDHILHGDRQEEGA